MGVNPRRGTGPQRRPLLAKEITHAQSVTRSAAEAARYLNVHVDTYTKYAKLYDLYAWHKENQTGRGIPRKKRKGLFGLQSILDGEHPNYDRNRLKIRLIEVGLLPEVCVRCGFDEKRMIDGRCPLMMTYKDGDSQHLALDNLELRCYNCTYLTTTKINVRHLVGPGILDDDMQSTGQITPDQLRALRDEMWQSNT